MHTCVIHVIYDILKYSYVYMYFSNYYSRLKDKAVLGWSAEIKFRGWLDPIPFKGFQQTENQSFFFLSKSLQTLKSTSSS